MTNNELKEYAAANRSRLKKQKVALGDLVMILVGEFVGKNGVIKGISVCGNEFTDPYYEVDMACEVPDKYKCRKTLIQSNNVIGGLSASDFEVICSRTPVSDIMKTEPKPKFNVGDKVVVTSDNDFFVPYVGKIVRLDEDSACITIGRGRINVPIDRLTPYIEPTAEEEEEKEPKLTKYPIGTKVHTIYGDGVVDTTIEGDIAVRLYGGGFCGIGRISGVQCKNDEYWQSYRMELAAKIAVAYAEKGRYEPEEIGAKAVEVANGVVERLKNGKV